LRVFREAALALAFLAGFPAPIPAFAADVVEEDGSGVLRFRDDTAAAAAAAAEEEEEEEEEGAVAALEGAAAAAEEAEGATDAEVGLSAEGEEEAGDEASLSTSILISLARKDSQTRVAGWCRTARRVRIETTHADCCFSSVRDPYRQSMKSSERGHPVIKTRDNAGFSCPLLRGCLVSDRQL
jgi:hypothetical protein